MWFSHEECQALEELRHALGTPSAKATIVYVLRTALGALSLEVFDRRAHAEPVDVERRRTSGRRAYDNASGAAPTTAVLRRRQHRALPNV